MNYDDIISLLSISEARRYIRYGDSYSYPVIGLHGNKIVDCFFLYCVSFSDETSAEGPFSTLIMDSEEKKLIEHQEKNPQILNNCMNCDDETLWRADGDFEKLYPQIRSFAFSKSINASQKELLFLFINTFKTVVNDSFYKIYRELFPEFFEWADQYQT